jgi:hypothetical protein
MGAMVLDRVPRPLEGLTRKGLLEQVLNALPPLAIANPTQDELVCPGMGQHVGSLPNKMRRTQLIDGDMLDVGEPQPGILETPRDRHAGKTGPVLDAPEAFFFRGGDQPPVDDERGGGVAMKRIDAENNQGRPPYRCADAVRALSSS